MRDSVKKLLQKKELDKLSAVKDARVFDFLQEAAALCEPASIFINTGSKEDAEYIRKKAVELGEEIPLATPAHTMHFDSAADQARDKKGTQILLPEGESLPGLNYIEREAGLKEIKGFLKGTMNGRCMIAGFYSLGPEGSRFSLPAVQITDSFYVAHSENILYRPGYRRFTQAGPPAYFSRFVHSAGELNKRKTSKNLDKRRVYIDVEGNTVYSVNTQYGGNTLGLKKLAMRLAIRHASKEGWLCEHMLIVGIKGLRGRVTYMTGAFPSLCGKTSTAMMEGEFIVGDDIAYIRNSGGCARGVNVEKGIFGIIQGVNAKDDALIWNALHQDEEVIFSNCLITPDKKVHWIKKGTPEPKEGLNYEGPWHPGIKDADGKEIPASHPNARFTIALTSLDNLNPQWDEPDGLEISAFVYGGRDSDTSVPVEEAFDWAHGIVTKGAILESETTAATLGKAGVRALNPMSNIDFLSVPLGKYIDMNLRFGEGLKKKPLIFGVNYFISGRNGEFLNAREDKRVWYKWMEKRVHGEADAIKTATGLIPKYEDLKKIFKELLGKEYTKSDYQAQFTLRIPENLSKLDRTEECYRKMSETPAAFFHALSGQRRRLEEARARFHSDYIPPPAAS